MVALANGTKGHALATVQGGALTAPTLLGRSAPRIPIGGRIRAGIKVLTRKAAEVGEARRLYDEGVAQGRSFEAIERDITAKCEGLNNPLTPKNVPYFTVRGEDFPNPQIARQIMDLYAEDRGDGMRRLYRFPVVFPADAWQNVMPHELVTWTASERRYWSEYSEDGQTRYCMTHQPVPVSNGQRAIRIFGGRKHMPRPENNGLCEPETCPEYQAKKCNLSGRFIFFMPGIRTLDAFDLPTNSFYAMQSAIEKFQAIGFMRGGRISGFLDGRRTPFYITKRLVEVSRIGDDGRPTRVSQWLIELEAPVDVSALLRPEDGLEPLEQRAAEATALLEGRPAYEFKVGDDGVIDMDQASNPAASRHAESPKRAAATAGTPVPAAGRALEVRPGTEQSDQRDARTASSTGAGAPAEVRKPRAAGAQEATQTDATWILDAAAALGVSADRFEQYAEKRWGKGWKIAAGGRKRALDEVTAFAEDPQGYQEKVKAELEVFS
jgi:hypothetical protein